MLEDIEIFCVVVKEQSFSRAARCLHLSPSIVTRRIVRLEQHLDSRLLHRTTRQVTLTEAGQQYFLQVSDILQALKLANKQVKSLNQDLIGTLKVGLPASISHLYLSRHLQVFFTQFPNLKLHIIHGNHLLDLLENGFDLILYCGHLPDSSFHYKKLGSWKKVICAAPTYLKKYGIPKQLKDLQQHNCLDHADNFYHSWHFQENGKIKDIPVSGNMLVNSSIDLCNLAVSGMGIAYLPNFSVYPELKQDRLISILEQHQPSPLPIYWVYPSKQYLERKTQVFIEFIEKLLKPILNFP